MGLLLNWKLKEEYERLNLLASKAAEPKEIQRIVTLIDVEIKRLFEIILPEKEIGRREIVDLAEFIDLNMNLGVNLAARLKKKSIIRGQLYCIRMGGTFDKCNLKIFRDFIQIAKSRPLRQGELLFEKYSLLNSLLVKSLGIRSTTPLSKHLEAHSLKQVK